MPPKNDFSDMRERLNDFAGRFREGAKSPDQDQTGHKRERRAGSAYWNLHDLFTKDVTREGLRDLIQRDTRDTFQYFTREIDFDSLRPLPWFKRYPVAAWRIFLALAYRLSPPRRIAFAIAILTFLVGLFQFQVETRVGKTLIITRDGGVYWFISIAILILLLGMELRDKLDLKGDLEIARQIQLGLVPSKPFQKGGFLIHSFMRTANTVGGDYFDIIELGGDSIALVIGDVAGKGMPAALLMALLQGSLRTLITAGMRGPELISKLNDYLATNIPSHSLVTLFYGELNTANGEFCYINAGHNAPFLMHPSRTFDRLPSTSIVLGFAQNSPFESRQIQLEPNDRLLLFTDGITEAFNEQEQEYSDERLAVFLEAHGQSPQEQLLQDLVADVLNFCGKAKTHDDMTLMVVGRDGAAAPINAAVQ